VERRREKNIEVFMAATVSKTKELKMRHGCRERINHVGVVWLGAGSFLPSA
jgi:hypothetical protein